MFIKKCFFLRVSAAIPMVLLAIQPLGAQTSGDKSEAARLEKLERAVDQLQKRNAELEQEVSALKKRSPFAPELGRRAKRKSLPKVKGISKSVSLPKRGSQSTSLQAVRNTS